MFHFSKKKIHQSSPLCLGIIGSGKIGSALAYSFASKGYGNVLLYDKDPGSSSGNSLDIAQSLAIEQGIDTDQPTLDCGWVKSTQDLGDFSQCHCVVITAGRPRKPGEGRQELLASNGKIIRQIGEALKATLSEGTFVIPVTNPVDLMTYLLTDILPSSIPVLGMAGVLDTGRYLYYLSETLGIPYHRLKGKVIGIHGPHMVPVRSQSMVQEPTEGWVPLLDWMARHNHSLSTLEVIEHKTRQGGTEIVEKFNGQGSAYRGPASAILTMIQKFCLTTQEEVSLPCSSLSHGIYGLPSVAIGLDCALVNQKVVLKDPFPLTSEEEEELFKGARELESYLPLL